MGVFKMPSLGADMEAGTLAEWLVKPGDTVKRGDIIAVVETQKGAIEIETFEAGTVARLDADVGQEMPVGAPLALILAEGEAAPEEAPPAAPAETEAPPEPAPALPVAREALAAATAGGILASPAARAAAADRGIDLAGVAGSGPRGAVVLADLGRAPAPEAPPKPQADRKAMLAEMRKAIAAAMAKSKREIPHYYLFHEIDLKAATDWLTATNADRKPEERLLMGALFLKATAQAAKTSKAVNGHWGGEGFQISNDVHMGFAVALRGGGLVAPAILETDTRSLDDLMAAMRDVIGRARAGRLRSSEMTMGTMTLSSLGDNGVDQMAGIIYPPQVALVTFGTPRDVPAAVDGRVEVRPRVNLSLAADHRASDGRLGAKFLNEIDKLLQSPEAL